jgi:hypothetical protein
LSLCDDDFLEFLHPLQLRLSEKNNQFHMRYGSHSNWRWDPDEATLTFSEPGEPDLLIEITLVGTSVEDSWEWSWANPNVEPPLKRDMDQVRDFGNAHGYPLLTEQFLTCDPDTGQEMTAVAAHILNALGSYHFSTGESVCHLIFREIHEPQIETPSLPLSLDALTISPQDKGWDEEPQALPIR